MADGVAVPRPVPSDSAGWRRMVTADARTGTASAADAREPRPDAPKIRVSPSFFLERPPLWVAKILKSCSAMGSRVGLTDSTLIGLRLFIDT